VPSTNKKDSKLDRNGMLRDVGVVVKDAVVFDEFHKVVKDRR